MSKQKYVIFAGEADRPAFVHAATIEKGQGQTIINESNRQLYVNRRGDIGFPNRAEAWGVRLIDGEIPPKSEGHIQVTDTRYKGQIKWLKWNDPQGCLIVGRFLRGYNTLDQLYQDNVLNATANISDSDEASGDIFFMRVLSGENEYDEETEKYLVDFLKISGYNRDSVSKSPDSGNYLFFEKNEKEEVRSDEKILDAKIEAFRIVEYAGASNGLGRFRNLYFILRGMLSEGLPDDRLSAVIKKLADSNAEAFVGRVQAYKLAISDVFEKAKAYNVLDLTKDGVIVAFEDHNGNRKREVIAEDVPGKKEKMLDWAFSNYLDDKAFSIAHQLKNITDKLK